MNGKDLEQVGWKLPAAAVILIILIWSGSWFLLPLKPEVRGTIGDMFGAVNALFSGLAFAGVVYAIILQRKELSLQREELKLTRAELHGQKEEMRVQNETLRIQKFENTFFQLLRMLAETTEAIDVQISRGPITNRSTATITGKDCFKQFFDRFEDNARFNGRQPLPIDFRVSYLEFFRIYQSDLGHYFRSLYHIVKLVDQADNIDQRLYTNLVRAQLSTYELALLFYNCLSELGVEKFKPLIEKYALLKNLPDDILLEKSHRELYNKEAF